MQETFPDAQAPRTSLAACLMAVLLTFGLFMVSVLSKILMPTPEADTLIREVSMTAPPPPQLPPPPESEQDEPPPEPEYEPPLPELSLQQLQISLQPGMNDGLGMGVNMGFETDIDLVSEMEKIFTFEELEQAPHLVYAPTVNYPAELRRRGIRKGTVEMIIVIDERGNVRVERVLSSSHPILEKLARSVAERSRFSITKVNETPVKVRGRWPLTIQQD